MVRGKVSDYLEFRSLDDTFLLDVDGTVLRVPCSKAAVFKSKDLSMSEKRQLMRFLQYCMDNTTETNISFKNEASLNQGRSLVRPQNKKAIDSPAICTDENFDMFLETSCKLSHKLRNSIMYAVGMCPNAAVITVSEGMSRVQRYLSGLGRFGKTAFICSSYGTSELAQAFCRLSSVHGSIFMLRNHVKEVELGSDDKVVTVTLEGGEKISTRTLIAPSKSFLEPSQLLCRKVLIVNGPLISLCTGEVSDTNRNLLHSSAMAGHPIDKRVFPEGARCILQIPPEHPSFNNSHTIHLLQLDNGAECAAPGYFVVHLSTICNDSIEGDAILDSVLQCIVDRSKTAAKLLGAQADLQVVWEMTFSRAIRKDAIEFLSHDTVIGVPDVELSLDSHCFIDLAESIFRRLHPDLEFIPEIEKQTQVLSATDSLISGVRIPQPVDLRWFFLLDGCRSPGGKTTLLS